MVTRLCHQNKILPVAKASHRELYYSAGSRFFFSKCHLDECWRVSPHNPCRISREKQTASSLKSHSFKLSHIIRFSPASNRKVFMILHSRSFYRVVGSTGSNIFPCGQPLGIFQAKWSSFDKDKDGLRWPQRTRKFLSYRMFLLLSYFHVTCDNVNYVLIHSYARTCRLLPLEC